MKRNALVLLVVVVTVTVMLLAARKMARQSGGGYVDAAGPIAGNVKGQAAPDFELKVLGEPGKTLKLSDYRGKGVLINFWATWCGPCKIEMPWLVEFKNTYGPQGFEIIGVAQEDTGEGEILEFTRGMGVNYPIVRGNNAVMDVYGSHALPTSVYVDRDGKIIERAYGLVSKSEIEEHIKHTLAGGAAQPHHGDHK